MDFAYGLNHTPPEPGVEEGDEMIDEKAEEFIVRFYEQMKMQKQVYTERCKAKGIIIN